MGNTLFGTFKLIRLNTSKCPFKVERKIRGFVDSEYDNTQLTIKKPVSIDVENIISTLTAQAIMKPSYENSGFLTYNNSGFDMHILIEKVEFCDKTKDRRRLE